MKTSIRNISSRLLALFAAFALTFAPGAAQAQPAYSFSQQELDQALAPIALYPDALLSQILMAATYPIEVVEAARWCRARPGLSGDDAVRAAAGENWDPSVKSLVAFPQVLARMDENLQWTQSLGDAFLDQQEDVMDTVQALRRRAQAAGNLRSDDRLSVVESGPRLLVQPFDPEVVYVPYYDPLIVYGSWWWPAFPPVYWRPWPGYYTRPAYAGGFYWGPPVGISVGFFFGSIDWRQRQVRVMQVNNYYYNQTTVRQTSASAHPGANRPGAWHHDADHRRGIAYRGVDAQRRVVAPKPLPDQGIQSRAADAHRYDRGIDARADARFDARRGDARPAVETRANAGPAPVSKPAPTAPSVAAARPAPAAPAAQRAPVVQPAQAYTRFDHHRETRGPAQAAQPAAVMKPAPVVQAAPAAQSVPATPPASTSRGERQAARAEPNARRETPPAPRQRIEVRSAPGIAHRETAPMTAARREPAARPQVTQASAPRADNRSSEAAAREDPGTKVTGRPKTVQ